MKSTGRLAPLILASMVSAGLFLSACGSDDDSSPDQPTSQDQTAPQTLKSAPSNPSGGASAPKSASDKKKNAPDDVISKRPGGPKDKSGGKPAKKQGKKKTRTGGVSPPDAAAPLSP